MKSTMLSGNIYILDFIEIIFKIFKTHKFLVWWFENINLQYQDSYGNVYKKQGVVLPVPFLVSSIFSVIMLAVKGKKYCRNVDFMF